MSIKYFRDKEPRPFRALQHDGTIARGDEIIEFTKGQARWESGILWLREPDMDEEVPMDYWVIEGDDSSFYLTYEPGDFEEDFERAAYMECE